MAEPTLQEVLCDLIERDRDYDPANPHARRSWQHGIDCDSIEWGYDGIEGDSGNPCDCWRSVVEALLSQPTPNAETVTAEQAWDEGFEAGATWPQHTPSGIPVDPPTNPYESEQAVTPDPPRIADMAPGTTFTANVPMPFVIRGRSAAPVIEDQVDGHYWDREDIDPSTIRDVREPEHSSKCWTVRNAWRGRLDDKCDCEARQ